MPQRPAHTRSAVDFRKKLRQQSHHSAHADEASTHADVPELSGIFRGRATLVEDDAAVGQLVATLRSAGSFAYDTEFIGETSYRPQLCLIQIATAQNIWLIDPLVNVELKDFWALLNDESIRKLVHAGEQDLEHVWRFTGQAPANVMDTQIAGGFVGLGYPASLSRLVLEMTGVKLAKGFTFTDWTQRPLSSSQIRYAADDVRYLPAIAEELQSRLTENGKSAWLDAECAERCMRAAPNTDPTTSWQRVRGSDTLDGRGVSVLRRLFAWRDACAQAADIPQRSFLKDELLIAVCKLLPKTADRLLNIKHMPRPVVEHHGKEILDCVAKGINDAPADVPNDEPAEPLLSDKARSDALWLLAQSLCSSQQIDPGVVMNRGDLADLDRAVIDGLPLTGLRLLRGWRGQAVGQRLEALIRNGGQFSLDWQGVS